MSSQTFCIIRQNYSFIKGEYTLFSDLEGSHSKK